LWQVSGSASDSLPVLVDCLEAMEETYSDKIDRNVWVPDMVARCTAAKTLGEMGKEAAAAKEALEKALGDSEPLVRQAVKEALEKISAVAPERSVQP
jgi:HEAT repeat protein